MALFIATSEGDRQRFVQSLLSRGWKPDPNGMRFRALSEKCFRVYAHGRSLRVSFWEPRDFKIADIPKPKRSRQKANYCKTDGHQNRRVVGRGLCAACYLKWARAGKPGEGVGNVKAGEVRDFDKGFCPQHPRRNEYRRGLCASCYRKWIYWNKPGERAKKVSALKKKRSRAAEGAKDTSSVGSNGAS